MQEIKYCIYLVTNKVNGKTYVGQHKYKKLYDGYIGSGALIKKAIKKYGKENFEIEYLETDLTDINEVDWFEQWYVTVLNPEYNIAQGGQGVRYRSTVTAQESLLKNREKNIRKWEDPQYRAWMMEKRAKRRGVPLPKSEEAKQHIKESIQKRKELGTYKPTMLGKHHSEETKKKMSDAQKGRPKPHEGRPRSEECRRKIAEANRRRKGTHYKKESKQK
jgi:group I intron endonuclease